MVGMIAWYGMLQSPATEAGAGDADDVPEGEQQPLLAAESRARLEDGTSSSN
jgi:iron transport multicopper oxidase